MTDFSTVQSVNCLSCASGAAAMHPKQRVSHKNSSSEGWICSQQLWLWLGRNEKIQMQMT